MWVRPKGTDRGPPKLTELKWTERRFCRGRPEGRLPMGDAPDKWSYGDMDAGFKNAALVLDETFRDAGREPPVPGAAHGDGLLAERQALHLHRHAEHVADGAGDCALDEHGRGQVVFISEYTGGGFGSKITGALTMMIPALLSKKLNAPVMMRISREEEHFIGRARPSIRARMKVGFAKDGRITALDMFLVSQRGVVWLERATAARAASIVSLLYQPPAMRWRGVTVMTNTPPRSAQSAPGGMQAIAIMEPILAKAARQLGVDQVALRRVNCPEGKAEYGPPNHAGQARVCDELLPEAGAGLRRGAVQVAGAGGAAAEAERHQGARRGRGADAFPRRQHRVRRTDRDHAGGPRADPIGHWQPGNRGGDRRASRGAEVLDVPWDACDIVWGDTSKHFPYTCDSGGSQTMHAMTRAAHATGLECEQRLKEVAAKKLGGQPAEYEVANLRVVRKGGGAGMSFAEAAQQADQAGRHLRRARCESRRAQSDEAGGGQFGGAGTGGFSERQVSARWRFVFVSGLLCRSGGRCGDGQVLHRRLSGLCGRGDGAASGGAGRADAWAFDAGHRPRDRAEVGDRSAVWRYSGRSAFTRTSRRRFWMCRWICNGTR